MRDTKYCDLKAAVDFMYRGEINVSQEQIPALLKVAESLKIRGLTDVSGEHAVVQGARGAKRAERARDDSPPKTRRRMSEDRASGGPHAPAHTPSPTPASELLPPAEPAAAPVLPPLHPDDVDIRPGIAEMIREEERVSVRQPAALPAARPAPAALRFKSFPAVLLPSPRGGGHAKLSTQ